MLEQRCCSHYEINLHFMVGYDNNLKIVLNGKERNDNGVYLPWSIHRSRYLANLIVLIAHIKLFDQAIT